MKLREELPAPEILLSNSDYWNKKMFRYFIEECNERTFADPSAGLELARHAPAFAEKVAPYVECPESLAVMACSVLGSAYRATGNHAEADRVFEQAVEHGRSLSDLETIDLTRRMAYLRLGQGRREEALELIDSAILTYRTHGDLSRLDFLGRCYVARGEIKWHQGESTQSVLNFATALTHLDLKRSARYVHSTLHNLMIALATCASPDALGQALKLLKQAEKRTYYKGYRLAKYKLKWLRALISLRFGSTRQAIRFLGTARDGLVKLGALHDVILISLDMNQAYFAEARPAWEMLALAEETYALCRSMSAGQEALSLLLQWRDAAGREGLSEETLGEVRERIAALGDVGAPNE